MHSSFSKIYPLSHTNKNKSLLNIAIPSSKTMLSFKQLLSPINLYIYWTFYIPTKFTISIIHFINDSITLIYSYANFFSK